MTIGGAAFVEAPEPQADPDNLCNGCHFLDPNGQGCECDEPMAAAPAIFGGDCIDRRVIYVRAHVSPPTSTDQPSLFCAKAGLPPASQVTAGGGFSSN